MIETSNTAPICLFDLSGGALCLDFSNTWEHRDQPETDRIRNYADLVVFARQSGFIDEETEASLGKQALRQASAATAVLNKALKLRDALYRIFSARAADRDVAETDLDLLNSVLAGALAQLRLQPELDTFGWTWVTTGLEFPLWPVARSAADLLTSDDLDRVRECEADNCDWLFIDRSRSRSRRWCSMGSCGNRAKARRHYQRCRVK